MGLKKEYFEFIIIQKCFVDLCHNNKNIRYLLSIVKCDILLQKKGTSLHRNYVFNLIIDLLDIFYLFCISFILFKNIILKYISYFITIYLF